jgi:hypothetical protein
VIVVHLITGVVLCHRDRPPTPLCRCRRSSWTSCTDPRLLQEGRDLSSMSGILADTAYRLLLA